MNRSTDVLSRLTIEAEVGTDHYEGYIILLVGPAEAVEDAGLEPHLNLVHKFLSMEDISCVLPKELLKQDGRQGTSSSGTGNYSVLRMSLSKSSHVRRFTLKYFHFLNILWAIGWLELHPGLRRTIFVT